MFHSKCDCGGGCTSHKITKTLLIVGGLNWGLVGLGMLLGSDLNVVNMVFGNIPVLVSVIYLLVGIAALVSIFGCKCSKCKEACASCSVDGKTGGGM